MSLITLKSSFQSIQSLPYRTEWRIYNDELSLAGTVDMVYEKENGELFIFDWKKIQDLLMMQAY